jgi:hypothetical protein
MLVAVTAFGSLWRLRSREEEEGSRLVADTSYYNTTGVLVNGTLRQRPKISGYVRFNGTSGFDPNYPSRAIERVFECAEPCVWKGDNKLLFKRMLNKPEKPDMFLIVLQRGVHGELAIGANDWRSRDSWLISFSENREQQEAMLLMPAHGEVVTTLGVWFVQPLESQSWVGRVRVRPGSSREFSARNQNYL